jgi:hypothetical protein
VVTTLLAFGVLVPPLLATLRRERDARTWAWALLPAAAALAFLATPGGAGYYVNHRLAPTIQLQNLRYGVFVLPLSAAVLASELRRAPRVVDELVVAFIGIVALAVTFLTTHRVVPWRVLGLGATAAIIGLLVVTLLWLRPGTAAAVLGLVAVAAAALAAPWVANHYDRRRLAIDMPFEKQRLALAPTDRTIAIAGLCPMYDLYGPRLDHHVEYLTGADHQLDRPLAATFDSWMASLEEHHITAVVLGSSTDACYGGLNLPYDGWVRAHPQLFSFVYQDAKGSVFRLLSAGP